MPDICGYWDRRTDDLNYVGDDHFGNALYALSLTFDEWERMLEYAETFQQKEFARNTLASIQKRRKEKDFTKNKTRSVILNYKEYNWVLKWAREEEIPIRTDIKEK